MSVPLSIIITMKSGRQMKVHAQGRVFKDDYGVSGSPSWTDCDDLQCYWPGKGKRREISPDLYDSEEAKATYIEAVKNEDEGARADYLLDMREARAERYSDR
jgi:hypothetical protein